MVYFSISVHCRQKHERPRDSAHWDSLRELMSRGWRVPIILNGDVWEYGDIARAKAATGVSSIMIARGALKNPSIFRAAGELDSEQVARRYLHYALLKNMPQKNTKYTVLQLSNFAVKGKPELWRALQSSKKPSALAAAYGIDASTYDVAAAGGSDAAPAKAADAAPVAATTAEGELAKDDVEKLPSAAHASEQGEATETILKKRKALEVEVERQKEKVIKIQ